MGMDPKIMAALVLAACCCLILCSASALVVSTQASPSPAPAPADGVTQPTSNASATASVAVYTYVEGKDQDGQTIRQTPTAVSRSECESRCTAEPTCNGIVTYATVGSGTGSCWLVRGLPSPYPRLGSAIASKPDSALNNPA